MTTVINLPSTPPYNAGSPALVSFAADLTGPMGGPTQRVLRLGSRFSLDVAYPAMKYADGQAFLAAMLAAEGAPLAVAFPQRGFTVGSPGSVVVNGAGQSGTTLNVKGATVGYQFKAGQFFSMISGGRRYVHGLTAAATADGSGHAALSIAPMLRLSPADADVLELTAPKLEGFIQLQSRKIPWTIELVRRVGVRFTVVEDR